MIDMVGGPTIYIGEIIPGTNYVAEKIDIDDSGKFFIINTKNGES